MSKEKLRPIFYGEIAIWKKCGHIAPSRTIRVKDGEIGAGFV